MMEINMELYDSYCEELRFKGIPVDEFDEQTKVKWFVNYCDNLEKEESWSSYQQSKAEEGTQRM
jgi:hypothetical protein